MSRLDPLRDALCRLDGEILALDQRRASAVAALVTDLARGEDVSDARLASFVRPQQQGATRSRTVIPAIGPGGTGLATIHVAGIATYDLEFPPYVFSTRLLAQTIAELSVDRSIGAIVIIFATPGGQVTGTQEAADAIFKARSKKPISGIVDPLAASAGYWLAAQCSSLVGVPSSDVGSIGVFVLHVESSRLLDNVGIKPTFIYAGENKTEGNSLEPLSDKAKSFYQSEVDQTYAEFLAAVARGRNTTVDIVKRQWGAGRVLNAKAALRNRMIDRIEPTPDQALASVVRNSAAHTLKAERILAKLKLMEHQ